MTVSALVLAPLASAALLLGLWTAPRIRRRTAVLSSSLHLFLSGWTFCTVWTYGPVTERLGNWEPPFGIVFRADLAGAGMVLVTSLIGSAVTIFALENIDSRRRDYGFHPLFFTLIAGVCGSFLTADLFNLYVWFECILLSSFVLISLGGEKRQISGALGYVVPNLFASMAFLIGLGLLYGATGTLVLFDLARAVRAVDPNLVASISLVFAVAFLTKAAVFPFFSWLPASYHTPPVAITALFAGLLSKVGLIALVRFFVQVVPLAPGPIHDVLVGAALGSAVVASLAAVVQTDLKKILAYLIVAHIGTMLAGLTLEGERPLAALLLYTAQHMVSVTAMFFLVGIIERQFGSTRLDRIGSSSKCSPWLGWLAPVCVLSLTGIPPVVGFWPKLSLILSGAGTGSWIQVACVVVPSLATLACAGKVWTAMTKQEPEADTVKALPRGSAAAKYVPLALLAGVLVVAAVFPGPLAGMATTAAEQLRTEVDLEELAR